MKKAIKKISIFLFGIVLSLLSLGIFSPQMASATTSSDWGEQGSYGTNYNGYNVCCYNSRIRWRYQQDTTKTLSVNYPSAMGNNSHSSWIDGYASAGCGSASYLDKHNETVNAWAALEMKRINPTSFTAATPEEWSFVHFHHLIKHCAYETFNENATKLDIAWSTAWKEANSTTATKAGKLPTDLLIHAATGNGSWKQFGNYVFRGDYWVYDSAFKRYYKGSNNKCDNYLYYISAEGKPLATFGPKSTKTTTPHTETSTVYTLVKITKDGSVVFNKNYSTQAELQTLFST